MILSADPVALFGTDEPQPARRVLRAGPLSAVLEEGNLRTIRYGSAEAVRAVNYLARDSGWGTLKPELTEFSAEEGENGITVSFRGLCESQDGRFAYRMSIRGEAGGRLVLEAQGEALTDFTANRIGFVVLHPAEAAGGRLLVQHTDGSAEETRFPQTISPDQPLFDIAALTHEPAPGLACTVTMEGDAFEMEDQRNWADASFKTYVRPLSKPRPFVLRQGERDIQRVTIAFEGAPPEEAAGSDAVALEFSPSAGRMPKLALFLEPDGVAAARPHAGALSGVSELVLRVDPARGEAVGLLRQGRALADAAGTGLAVEWVCDLRDPRTEAGDILAALGAAAARPSAVLLSPRREFKTRPSGRLPEGEAPVGALVAALKAAGFSVPVGAGTPSNFTEFNRNPPDGGDFVFFGVSSIVHAADDRSVMETLSVYPALVESAEALCPKRPIWLGPCTIATRHNPYGADVVPNPGGGRVPAARIDPRAGALFGAAFMVGVAAQAASPAVERLILAAPTGPFGLWDDEGNARPTFAVHRVLSEAAGRERIDLRSPGPTLAAVAFRAEDRLRVLVASLSEEDVTFTPPGRVLSAELLEPTGFRPLDDLPASIRLPPYRVLLLDVDPASS